MKKPPRVEQGQTEPYRPVVGSGGPHSEISRKQKEGYSWHADIICCLHITPLAHILMIRGHATAKGTGQFAESSPADISNYKEFAGLRLSNVGMGTYLGEPDDITDQAVIQAVYESALAGINVFDTAINYRSQKAERALGAALSGIIKDGIISREGIFLSTKNGYVTSDADIQQDFWEYINQQYVGAGTIEAGDISSGYHCMSIPFLEDQLNRSMKNLDVDCIDLMYLHNAVEGQYQDMPKDVLLEKIAKAIRWFESQRRSGRIQYYGLATWECFRVSPDNPQYLSLEWALDTAREAGGESHGLRFVQLPYNMYLDQALREPTQCMGNKMIPFLEAARMMNIGVFTSVPFMQGRLLAPNILPQFATGPPSVRSLQFVRSTPGVLAPLVGHKSPSHVSENLAVMKIPPMDTDTFSDTLRRLLNQA